MNFFKTLGKSIYSPEFYKEIPKKTLGSAVGYFLLFSLLLSVLFAIFKIFQFSAFGGNRLIPYFREVVGSYPQELVVTIRDGKASINREEPYIIDIPKLETEDGFEISQTEKIPLVMIDTKTPYSAEKFEASGSNVWLTEDSLFIKGNRPDNRALSLSEVPNIEITKQRVDSLMEKVRPWFKFFIPIFLILMIFGLFFVSVLRLAYLFLFALIIMLLSILLGKKLTYGESYKVGLHAMTLPLIVAFAFNGFNIGGFPFMFSIFTLLMVSINYFINRQDTTTTSA